MYQLPLHNIQSRHISIEKCRVLYKPVLDRFVLYVLNTFKFLHLYKGLS
jgi:hypothetical protein